MGYRTVVMLNNDRCNEWSADPDLGRKISHAMNHAGRPHKAELEHYGHVVQCEHADTQSLVILDGYSTFYHLASQDFTSKPFDADVVSLLKEAAAKFGYRLVKKPTKD